MKKITTIEESWNSFEKQVIPSGASKIQKQEMRRAYYSGVLSLFIFLNELDENNFTEELAAKKLIEIEEEVKLFFSRIGKEL